MLSPQLLLFLVNALITLFEHGKASFFCITVGERLSDFGSINTTNNLFDWVFAQGANFQWGPVNRPTQFEAFGAYATRLLLIILIH